jgi:hypothetical protein
MLSYGYLSVIYLSSHLLSHRLPKPRWRVAAAARTWPAWTWHRSSQRGGRAQTTFSAGEGENEGESESVSIHAASNKRTNYKLPHLGLELHLSLGSGQFPLRVRAPSQGCPGPRRREMGPAGGGGARGGQGGCIHEYLSPVRGAAPAPCPTHPASARSG